MGKLSLKCICGIKSAEMWDVRSGFMPRKNCVNHLSSLSLTVQKYLFDGMVFAAFVRLTKVYDQVTRAVW